MAADLRIWLLGGFRAELGSGPVAQAAWRRSRARAVVELLALAPGHRLHREQLMEELWPDLAPEAAAANLRKAVHYARQALGSEHLRLRGEVLSLEAAPLWIDVDAFEAAAEAGHLDTAIGSYGGDLLPEDRFAPWASERREQLRARFALLLAERARALWDAGDAEAAAAAFQRLAEADPLNEEAVAGLMRAHALAGRRHLALRWYGQLEARLAADLGVDPEPRTRRLREEIASGRFPPPATSPPTRPTPAGPAVEERKVVTAMMAAVAAPAPADPERARLELDGYAGLVTEVVESWGGTAERLAGGSVLAVFGVPRVHEDDAARALRAGLEILERSPLPSRIGLGTGEVIARTGPGASPREIAGEALQAAGRLQEEAEPATAIAAERTCRAAGAGFRFGEPLRLPLAGGPELCGRRLLGLASGPARGAPRLRCPMVGRDQELGAMLHLFNEVVASGRPRLLTIIGPAGVGKSRMAAEAVAAMVAAHPGTRVLRGRCLAAGRGVTYWALGEILRAACGISLDDPAPVARARLWDGLRAVLGPVEPAGEIEATVFALAATAGISLPESPLEHVEPKKVADELGRAWPRFATACAAAGPTLLLIEDLHWADEQLLDTLELAVARSSGPLLVVATARPELAEVRPGFGAAVEGLASISLRPLAAAHSLQLLDSLAPAGGLPAGRREEVLARAEGNPLFLEELVLHLSRGDPGGLPDTLQSLLAARLDALPVPEKRVLQQAAVVGRVFWEEPVARALGPQPVAPHLERLERRGFIVRRSSSTFMGQAELAFRHALIHDVAYASVPRARRARAHAEVGAWLEELAADRLDELAELLAYHYGAAAAGDGAELAWSQPAREQVRATAFGHLLRAGGAARRRFAVARAADLHEQARALAATDRERLLALEELGDDHDSAYHGEAATDCYTRALQLARADPARAADRSRLCRKIAWLMAGTPGAFRSSPDPAAPERLVAEGLATTTDEVSRAWLLVARGVTARLWRGSEPFGQGTRRDPMPVEERIADAERALQVGRARGLDELTGAATTALSVLYGMAGRYGEVLALARRELERLPRIGSRLEQADVLRTASVYAITIGGDFEEGLGLAWRSHDLLSGGNPHQVMHATWPLLAALYHLGRWHEIPPLVEEHLAAFEQEPATECHFVRDGPIIGATVLAHTGDLEGARALAAVAGDPMADLDSASAWQGWFALATGDPAAARRISGDKAYHGRLYGPQHTLVLLEALVALEDWSAVDELLPWARAAVAGNALLAPFRDRAEGRRHAIAGRLPQARRALRRALAGFDRLGVPFEAARTRERLAELEPAARPANR